MFYVGFGLGHSGNEMSRLKKIGIGVWNWVGMSEKLMVSLLKILQLYLLKYYIAIQREGG